MRSKMVEAYARARAWIEKNIKPGEYVTFEDMMKDVFKQNGFNNISKQGRFSDAMKNTFGGKFKFESNADLRNYLNDQLDKLKKEEERIKAQREALEKLGKAKNEEEVEKAVRTIEKPQEAIKAAHAQDYIKCKFCRLLFKSHTLFRLHVMDAHYYTELCELVFLEERKVKRE